MGNFFRCLPSWEETLKTTKKARNTAKHFEERHTENFNALRVHAENALYRGNEEEARRLLKKASLERRRAARAAALLNDAEDTNDFIHQTQLRNDLMTAREVASFHMDDSLKKKKKTPAKQGASIARFNQTYEESDEAFKEAVGLDSSEEEDEDDVDSAWVAENLDAIRLKVKEQKSEAEARAARKKPAVKSKGLGTRVNDLV